MTTAQQRITLAISVIVGLTLLVITGLTFLVEPLTQDLALSDEATEQALVAPTIASLLVVFIAGRAGDRFGQRRTIVVAAAVFTLGAAALASAQADPLTESTRHPCVLSPRYRCGAGLSGEYAHPRFLGPSLSVSRYSVTGALTQSDGVNR